MWALAAMFAVNLLQGSQTRKKAKAANKNAEFNAGIQDQLVQANNTVAAAGGALSRFRQSLGNQMILKNAAQQNEALSKNLIRLQDQALTQGLNTRIQAAEATGSLMAAASAAGVGGGTVDQLNSMIRGREARELEQQQRGVGMAANDTLDRIRQVNEAASAAQDTTVFLDRVTQVKSVPGKVAVPGWGEIIGGAAVQTLGSQAGLDAVSKVGTGISSFFNSAPSTAGANLQVGGFSPVTGVQQPVEMPQSWFKG